MAKDILGQKDGVDFFVGSDTAPAPAPAPSPAVTRYTTPPTTPIAETPTVNKPTLATVDEASIREETRKRMQASIDAINANYVNLIGQERLTAQDRSGQTRSLNARSGTLGSDFGNAAQEKTTQFNKQQEKYLVDQQNAQVNAVLQNIEDRASTEIQRRKEEALGKYQMDMAEYEKEQEKARGDLQILAQSGLDLETLSPAQKTALFKQAGYSDNQFAELIYNAMKPKPKQIDYKFEKLADGRGMFYGVDPNTGQLKRIDVSVDLPPDWQIQIAPDGTVIGFDKNTGQARVMSGKGEFQSPLDKAQIDKIYSDIANGQGAGLLSIDEANKLGVPYGTTKQQAIGFIPGQKEKVQAAETALTNVQTVIDLIDTLKNHKGFDSATGALRIGTAFPGTQARDFVAKFDQLKALLSLDNIKYLKGTGAISDAEQQLLANAASSLRRDTSTQAVKDELDRLRKSVVSTQEKLQNVINAGSQDLLEEFDAEYGPSFKPVGTDTKSGVRPTGMRTDRHNNPTAFTTDIARIAGLKEGVDYTIGDSFSNGRYHTARLLGDAVGKTIKVIDKIGFYTQSGQPRWSYINSIPQARNWSNLSYSQKKNVIAQMYQHEGGSQLKQYFA